MASENRADPILTLLESIEHIAGELAERRRSGGDSPVQLPNYQLIIDLAECVGTLAEREAFPFIAGPEIDPIIALQDEARRKGDRFDVV